GWGSIFKHGRHAAKHIGHAAVNHYL
nr:Chain A, Pleurocidin-like peptide WF4 [Pseudopleuronectes americanus]